MSARAQMTLAIGVSLVTLVAVLLTGMLTLPSRPQRDGATVDAVAPSISSREVPATQLASRPPVTRPSDAVSSLNIEVVSEFGSAIAGAKITMDSQVSPVPQHLETDSLGKCALPGAAREVLDSILVEASDHFPTRLDLRAISRMNSVKVTLRRQRIVRGRVVDGWGRVVMTATVSARTSVDSLAPISQCSTDQDGFFSIAIPAGQIWLTAVSPLGTTTEQFRLGDPEPVVMQLAWIGSLEGTLATSKGQPIGHASVVVTPEGESSSAVTDEAGRFRIEHVRLRQNWVFQVTEGALSWIARVSSESGSVATGTARVRLQKGEGLTLVLDGATPGEELLGYLQTNVGLVPIGTHPTGDQSRLILSDDVPPNGRVAVQWRDTSGPSALHHVPVSGKGSEIHVRTSAAAITLRVSSPRLASVYRIHAVPSSLQEVIRAPDWCSLLSPVTIGVDGAVAVACAVDWSGQIFVDNGVVAWRVPAKAGDDITLNPPEQVDLPIRLQYPVALEGSRALIRVEPADIQLRESGVTRYLDAALDSGGESTVAVKVATGQSYHLVVSGDHIGTLDMELPLVSASPLPVIASLTPAFQRVVYVTTQGTPASGVLLIGEVSLPDSKVRLENQRTQVISGRRIAVRSITDARGFAAFRNLPADAPRWAVQVLDQRYVAARFEFDGTRTDAEIELSPRAEGKVRVVYAGSLESDRPVRVAVEQVQNGMRVRTGTATLASRSGSSGELLVGIVPNMTVWIEAPDSGPWRMPLVFRNGTASVEIDPSTGVPVSLTLGGDGAPDESSGVTRHTVRIEDPDGDAVDIQLALGESVALRFHRLGSYRARVTSAPGRQAPFLFEVDAETWRVVIPFSARAR